MDSQVRGQNAKAEEKVTEMKSRRNVHTIVLMGLSAVVQGYETGEQAKSSRHEHW